MEFGLGQSHCIVIVAWMYHIKYKPYEWDANHLDNIICKGDWLQFNLLCDNEKEPHRSENLGNIHAACLFSKEHFVFEPLMQLSFFGKFTGLRNKLNNYMNRCAEDSRSVLLTCKQISFGVFGYIGRNGAIEYCLFDPHGRNSNGFFDYTANSCVMFFKTIDNLMNLLARDELFTHCRYECVPIQKNLNIRKSHYVTVHNSQQFVEKYSYGNWVESSGSSDDESMDGEGNNVVDMSVKDKATSKRRTIKAPKRYEPSTHPSFLRGKLREDRKRLNGMWKKWYVARDPEQKKDNNSRKKYLWARSQRA